MILAVTIVILFLASPFVWWYMFVLQRYKSLKNIPGPKPLPIVGNALSLGNTPHDIYNNLKKFHREYGDIFKIYIGNELRVFITSPDLIREILTSNVHITKSDGYDLLKPWISEGILTSTGNKWKLRRRMITSSFHFKILDKFIEVFNSCGDILTKRLSQEVGNKCLNVYPYISLGAFDIVCQTSMGLKNSVQDGNNSEYVKTVRGFINIAMIRFFSAWERIDWMFEWFSKNAKTHSSYVKILHSFADNIIQIRRKEKDDKKLDNFDSESGVKKKSALLDMLLESEDSHNLSNDDIKEEINTVLFAGHDTSSSAISFILLCLAENPKIQEKVYEEIVSVMGQKDNNYVSIQDIQNMKYFDLVFKESQRLYATVPFIERRLEEDWSVGGYDFPRNTFLVIYMYGLHHDEKYFPDPYKFDPDRFLPENQSKRHVYSYIPFSAGPRNCVGQKFAILAIKTIVIKILKNYRVVAVPGFKPKLEAAAVLKSLNGVCIELQQR